MDWVNFLVSIGTGSYSFVDKYGYFGLFLVSFLGSASIIFPLPSLILTFTFGVVLNPFLVGLVTALGSAIGESTGYLVGLGSKKILEKKYAKGIKKVKKTFKKYGPEFWIILLAATPLPDDIVGIICGIIKYDFRRYFIALFIGKLMLSLLVAYAGHYSLNWVLDFVEPRLGL